jgi:hypothetical protein
MWAGPILAVSHNFGTGADITSGVARRCNNPHRPRTVAKMASVEIVNKERFRVILILSRSSSGRRL